MNDFLRTIAKSSEQHYITDAELTELANKIDFEGYLSDAYEYSGSFIITKDYCEFDNAIQNMCCGIVTKEEMLNDGTMIYFAFDYGH